MLKKIGIAFIPALVLLTMAIIFCQSGIFSASAAEVAEETAAIESVEAQETEEQEAVEPRLLTRLSLAIGASNGEVYARVKNEFTLGFAVVQVYAQLYSSYTYQDSYTNMTLESQAYIEDLNIYETIRTAAPINGEQKYWMARAYYKIDNGQWKDKVTKVWLVDANGNAVEYN